MTTKIGHGVFGWDSTERRTDRYGGFVLSGFTLFGETCTSATSDRSTIETFLCKRVRLRAAVVAARESGHAGDAHLGIKPTRPYVDEVVDLGVGLFYLEANPFPGAEFAYVLKPGDGRETFWIDPRKFYRLHDQTVDLLIEETQEDFSPAPDIENLRDPSEVISNGDSSFQFKRAKLTHRTRMLPKSTRLGDGMFLLSTEFEAGETIELFEK